MGACMLNIFKTAADINKKKTSFFLKKKWQLYIFFMGACKFQKSGTVFVWIGV